MYKSPIEIIQGQMQTQLEGEILRAVQQVGVNVDKAELLRALNYDRQQYEKGYADAMTQKRRWISVKGRMPEHGDVVLCHHKHTDYPIVCQWDERTGAWIDDKWSYGTGCITHWMPLPEPPKED